MGLPPLWVSRDGGDTWSSGYAVANATARAVSPRDAATVSPGSRSGLYVSRAAGKSGPKADG